MMNVLGGLFCQHYFQLMEMIILDVFRYKPREGILDLIRIKFPVTLMNVPKFEKQINVSINVYGFARRKFKYTVVPLHVTSEKKEQHINLLYV